MVSKGYRIITYGVYGFLLGLFFPVVSTIAEIYKYNLDFSISSLRGLHFGQPLMLVIDAAPIILSASFALIGIQSARAFEASTKLDEIKIDQEMQAQNEHFFLEALISNTSFAVVTDSIDKT